VYDKADDVLYKVYDIVSCSSLAASLKCKNDRIHCEDPYTDEWLNSVNILND